MSTIQAIIAIPLLMITIFGADATLSQTYPNRPIRIVTTGAAGSPDIVSRLIAQGISPLVGQSVIVDNRTDTTSVDYVSQAAPDGYTVLVTGANFFLAPLLHKMEYDPVKDFSSISLLATTPSVLVVPASLPINSMQELIALAKSKPGTLNFGTPGVGSPAHLSVELLNSMAGGLKMVRVDYKSVAAILADLSAGRVQLFISGPGGAMPLVKSGKLKALGVTSAQPSILAPGVPPIAASVPGYDTVLEVAMYAPANTPTAIINRLNEEDLRYLKMPDTKEKFLNAGVEVAGTSPAAWSTHFKAEMVEWSKVIKDADIKVE